MRQAFGSVCIFTILFFQAGFAWSQPAKTSSLPPALEILSKVLNSEDIKFDITKSDPRRIEIPYSVRDFTACIIAAMETRSIFSMTGFVAADSKKYPLSKEKLSEIAQYLNDNTRLSKYVFSLRNNAVIFQFKQIVIDGISEREMAMMFALASAEIRSCILTMRFVCEDSMAINRARALSDGLAFDGLPMKFAWIRKYEERPMGYMAKLERDGAELDEYRYDLGRKWKDGTSDPNFDSHFKELSASMLKLKDFSDIKSVSTGNEKIGGSDFRTETFSMKRNGKSFETTVYLSAKGGKLLKFRSTFNEPVKEGIKDIVKQCIAKRTSAEF